VPGLVSNGRRKDAVQRASERLFVVKTTLARFAAVRDAIAELHLYEVWGVAMLPIFDGSFASLACLAGGV